MSQLSVCSHLHQRLRAVALDSLLRNPPGPQQGADSAAPSRATLQCGPDPPPTGPPRRARTRGASAPPCSVLSRPARRVSASHGGLSGLGSPGALAPREQTRLQSVRQSRGAGRGRRAVAPVRPERPAEAGLGRRAPASQGQAKPLALTVAATKIRFWGQICPVGVKQLETCFART